VVDHIITDLQKKSRVGGCIFFLLITRVHGEEDLHMWLLMVGKQCIVLVKGRSKGFSFDESSAGGVLFPLCHQIRVAANEESD
jgi:hypothetical protein